MDTPTFLTWLATGLQFVAGFIAMKYPNHKVAYWSVLGTGIAIIAIAAGFWWEKEGQSLDPRWALFPVGMAVGLALGWRRDIVLARPPQDTAWRGRNQLEIYEIACRAVGIGPVLPVPSGAALSMLRLLGDAVRDRDLGVIGGVDGDFQKDDGLRAQISHGSLAEFALASGNDQLMKFVNDWKPLENADFSKLLYLGDIHLDTMNLANDKVQLAIRCFNGSPGVATVGDVTGEIEYRSPTRGACAIGTPILVVTDGISRASGAWGTELFLVYDLSVPTEVGQEIAKRLDDGETVELGFQNLTIHCHLGRPVRHDVRMPLWNGVRFKKIDGHVYAINWVIAANVNITLGSHVSR